MRTQISDLPFINSLKGLLVLMILSTSYAHSSSQSRDDTQRVVSIDGSITEIIYALGEESTLVGVDTTSRYPASVKELPNVGYMRSLSSEGIMALAPEKIIVSEGAGPEKVLKNLQQAGLDMVIIEENRSIAGVQEKIKTIAKVLNALEKGEALVEKVKTQTDSALSNIKDKQPARILFLLAAGNHGVMVAGADTQASAMIDIIGGINVADQFTSYKPLTPESALQLNPDALVIANTGTEPFNFDKFPTLKLTKAFKENRVVDQDSMLLLGFGPRIGEALALMGEGIYTTNPKQ